MHAGWLERRTVKRRLSLGSLRSAQQQPVIWTRHWAEIRDGVLLLFPARPKDEAAAAIALPEAAIRLQGRKAQPCGVNDVNNVAILTHNDICMELLPASAHVTQEKKSSRSKALHQRQVFRFPPGAALGEWLRALAHVGVVTSEMEWEEALGALPSGNGADSEPCAAATTPSQDHDIHKSSHSDAATSSHDDMSTMDQVAGSLHEQRGSTSYSSSSVPISGSDSGSDSSSGSGSSTGSDSDSIAESDSDSDTRSHLPPSLGMRVVDDAAADACSTAADESSITSTAVAGSAPPHPPRVEPAAQRKPSYQTGLVGSYFAVQRQDIPVMEDARAGEVLEVGARARARVGTAASPRHAHGNSAGAPAPVHVLRAHAAAAGPLARRAQQLGRRRRASGTQTRSASMFVQQPRPLVTAVAPALCTRSTTNREEVGPAQADDCCHGREQSIASPFANPGLAGTSEPVHVNAGTSNHCLSSLTPANSQQHETGMRKPLQMAKSARRFTDSVALSEQGNLLDFIAAGRTEWHIEKIAAKSGKRQRRMLGVDLWQVTKSSNKGVSGLGAAITKRRRHVVLCAVADILHIDIAQTKPTRTETTDRTSELHDTCVVLKYLPPVALLTGTRAISREKHLAGSSVASSGLNHTKLNDTHSALNGEHTISYRFYAQSQADGAEIVGKIRHLMGIHRDSTKLSRLSAFFPRPVAFPVPKALNEGEA